uniref:Globoside alpha-1,3-N-acetylgalactosaminyltransferase 1-like n=1 Tax=Stegastes partitus TaxID=144197 RepID=A0A3B5AAB9_9TELE
MTGYTVRSCSFPGIHTLKHPPHIMLCHGTRLLLSAGLNVRLFCGSLEARIKVYFFSMIVCIQFECYKLYFGIFVFFRRTDVNSVTNWNAPLVWEGTFDPVVIDNIYRRINPRIAVVVFAVGKYTRFLKGFLETGEKYFLYGFRVTYYVFTDNEQEVPKIALGEGRKISVLTVPSAKRWQDVVLGRMKWIRGEADYLFMMDIDSVFHNRFGAESLSQLSAVLHRGYYQSTKREDFPYERRPESKAYIPPDEGDYYYTAAVWGGYLEDMYKYCYEQSEEDAKNNIEAVWQEESHLNKYLLYNKPTKVLSSEYLWSDYDAIKPEIKVVRISQVVKDYAKVRPNGGM